MNDFDLQNKRIQISTCNFSNVWIRKVKRRAALVENVRTFYMLHGSMHRKFWKKIIHEFP